MSELTLDVQGVSCREDGGLGVEGAHPLACIQILKLVCHSVCLSVCPPDLRPTS